MGGAAREATGRLIPVESDPSDYSLAGLEVGATVPPVAGPFMRLITGKSTTGLPADRWMAALELGLELFPVFDAMDDALTARRVARTARTGSVDEMSGIVRGGMCPPPGCFVAGTLVALTASTALAIEMVDVGDRVQTVLTQSAPKVQLVEGPRYRINVELDAGTSLIEARLLRSRSWLDRHGLSEDGIGETVRLRLSEMGVVGDARVVSVSEFHGTGRGEGREVTATIRRSNNDVYELSFVEGGEPLRGTGGHPLYSLDRDTWVSVRDLRVGERLQTAEGAVTVEALEKVRGEHRVYNLEVEGDHEYLVGEAGVRAHNQSACSSLATRRGDSILRREQYSMPMSLRPVGCLPSMATTSLDESRLLRGASMGRGRRTSALVDWGASMYTHRR